MRVQILPASAAGTPGHPLTGFVIDGVLAIDAGPLGGGGSVVDQAAISHVLLTHAHIDHVAGLPVFLDNVYQLGRCCPAVYGLPATLDALRSDIFNGRLMPDFIGMSATMAPFVSIHPVTPDLPFAVGRYTVTPIPLRHTIPTVGYLIDDKTAAVAILTDTAPIPEVLAAVANWPRLRAVFLECSFPNSMAELAGLTRHQTTGQFLAGAKLLPAAVPVYAVHIKPRYWAEVTAELAAAAQPNVQIGEAGRMVEV
ncbi:MAG: 3',5'-cyclic-nucleotide phosphodiesterase [Fimbriiglobus sp.]|jgi:ribonuclease BN (tRNA processing enzyme)|nr:3',5'-cyclic-nucleotide phosphodiesterase [Fimbriiglobus sp.]